MTVKELIIELENQDMEEEVFLFFKTPDGKTCFTSNITEVSWGKILNEYGQLESGVLLMKE